MLTAYPAAWQIQFIFVIFVAVVAWLRPLGLARQLKVSLLALIAIGAMVLVHFAQRWLNPLESTIVRDWLPAVLLLVPYWQIGQFFTEADPEMERKLAEFDRKFFRALGIKPAEIAIGPIAGAYLEVSYVMVYPLIPLALFALGISGLERFVAYYWIVVLPATYICFAMTPFVQAMPPRSLSSYEKFRMPLTSFRKVNNFLLRNASIQAITFPSGHVGSAVTTALVLLRLEPWVGLIFLVIALSIAVATVVGGYHYAADVLLASLVALVVFVATFSLKPA